MKYLTYRTYVFVERHLSPIDKGIQSAHAVIEYYENRFKKAHGFSRGMN